MPEAIRIRAGAHSFEGKVFTIVACSAMSDDMVDMLCTSDEQRRLMAGRPNAFSGIFGPDGRLIAESVIDEEGSVVAEIDAERCIEPKQYQDIIGHYNRFDVFDLRVNRRTLAPVRFSEAMEPECFAERRSERTSEARPDLPDERIRLVGTSE
jgi:nitrilase